MSTSVQFKLKNSKPDKDFIEWNEQMSKYFDQDYYYEHSNLFILWIEKIRLTTISDLIKKHMQQNNLFNPTIVEVGCGTGQVLEEILRKVKTNNLIGVEPLDGWREKTHKRGWVVRLRLLKDLLKIYHLKTIQLITLYVLRF